MAASSVMVGTSTVGTGAAMLIVACWIRVAGRDLR